MEALLAFLITIYISNQQCLDQQYIMVPLHEEPFIRYLAPSPPSNQKEQDKKQKKKKDIYQLSF
jgi:hypothetical protein